MKMIHLWATFTGSWLRADVPEQESDVSGSSRKGKSAAPINWDEICSRRMKWEHGWEHGEGAGKLDP